MKCPGCGEENPPNLEHCNQCGWALADPSDETALDRSPIVGGLEETELLPKTPGSEAPTRTASHPSSPRARFSSATGELPPYVSFGNRYEILELLGEGGMGRVYKAWDRELEKVIALKTIRGERSKDEALLKRFKQELLLARKVTHRNVIRIHDLGESEGVRFFTMEYIPGESLRRRIERQKRIPAHEAVPLLKQMLSALEEAHHQGVIHRDLKPENIMIDPEGVLHIMDFGIARSAQDTGGLTGTGMMIGTPDYMSPEQVRGEKVDARSDVFSFGVILYQMLTGELPFLGDTPAARVMMRLSKKPRPPIELQGEIPVHLSSITMKCLELDRELRYSNVQEILEDIEREQVDRSLALRLKRAVANRKAGLAAALALLALGGGATVLYLGSDRETGPPMPTTSLALLPLQNATGDPSYDWVQTGVPDLLRTDLLQSKNLRLVGEERLVSVLDGLRIDQTTALRPPSLQRIGSLVGADHILTASLMRAGDQFRIEASLRRVDAAADSAGTPIRVVGEGDASLFSMVDELSQQIRDRLGVASGWRETDRSVAELSTSSMEALRLYNEGLALTRAGNDLNASRRLEGALEEDPSFALARAYLAETYDRLGYPDKASEEARRAAEGLQTTSPYEAAQIRAIKALIENDLDAAEASYRQLTEILPNNADAFFDLADVAEQKGDLEGALASLRRVIELDPKHPNAHYALGRVQVKLGDSAQAFSEFNTALGIHVESGNAEGRATVLNGLGNTYYALSQYDEALRYYRESLDIRKEIGDQRGVRVALGNVASVLNDQGLFDKALQSAQESLEIARDLGDRSGLADAYSILGDIYDQAGHPDQAQAAYQESLNAARQVDDETRLAENLANLGYINGVLGHYTEAFYFHKEALAKRREIGDKADILRSLIELGIVEQAQGRYEESLEYYLEGLTLARELGEKAGVIVVSVNLSNIHEDQAEYGPALALLLDAESLSREIDDPRLLATSLAYLGSTRTRIGDFEGAESAFQEASNLVEGLNNRALLGEVKTLYGSFLLTKGDVDDAKRILAEAVAATSSAKDHRLTLRARLFAARATGSIGDLESVRDEAESSGLDPLLTLCRLALSQSYLASGSLAEAENMADRAIELGSRLQERDLVFQAHHVAGLASQRQEKSTEAIDHYQAALSELEEMLLELGGVSLDDFRARPETVSFTNDAEAFFQEGARDDDLARVQKIVRPSLSPPRT
jgi:tetratricopeptide (TPR) repeat protein